MPGAATVRPLRPEDRDAWLELWEGYLRFYRETLPAAVTAETFRRLCAGEGATFALVAERDGRPVGMAHAVVHASTWSLGGYCYLEDLFVAPEARGGAVGRLLIDAVADGAGDRGATKLHWQTQAFNGRARSLYDQAGHLSSAVIYERDLSA